MLPRRLPPSSPSLPASSSTPGTSPSPSAAGNLTPTGTGSPTVPAQPAPLPHVGPIAGSSAASGPARKRPLPLSATPRSPRPRTETAALPALPATVPRSHAALQHQTQAFSAIAKALGHFGDLRWVTLDAAHRQALLAVATDLPSASPSPGITETERQQQHLHAVLSAIQQATQDMDRLVGQPPLSPRLITPAMLNAFVPAVHYGGVTIDGPQVTPAGQRRFYLEQQDGHACAQHAVNAMVGGPLVSLLDFARYETHLQAGQEATSAFVEDVAAVMRAYGVHAETVQGTLQALDMPMHCHVHRPLVNAQGLLGLDPVQARFLDSLQTDRLLLQADRYEGDSASSHYVAFRRDAGQWVLLDSLERAPQHGVAPSAYLLGDERIKHFTALWPQHALQGSAEQAGREPAGAAGMTGHTPSRLREGHAGAPVTVPQGWGAQTQSEVQRKFLAGLVPYAAGKSLIECARESGLASFKNYLSAAGGLQKDGQALYAKLTQAQQKAVDQAIGARKMALLQNALDTASVLEKFLAGLVPYAAGKNLIECARESGLASFKNYLSAAGGLQKKGQALHAKLTQAQQKAVDQAIETRKVALVQNALDTASVMEPFLAGLVPYAAGKSLKECERESGLAGFHNYLSAAGGLKKDGQALYTKLVPERQAEVDRAIGTRKVALLQNAMDTASVMEQFLAGLTPYAAGKSLQECERESGLAGFYNYLSAAGGLKKPGQALYTKLAPEGQAEVEAACLSRTVWFARENITGGQFLDALRWFSSSLQPIEAIEQAVGLKKGCLGLLLCDTGLNEAGRRYVAENFDAQTQGEIEGMIRRRVSPP